MAGNFLQHDFRGDIYFILKCSEFPTQKCNAGLSLILLCQFKRVITHMTVCVHHV